MESLEYKMTVLKNTKTLYFHAIRKELHSGSIKGLIQKTVLRAFTWAELQNEETMSQTIQKVCLAM
jgi:hypothetical protein